MGWLDSITDFAIPAAATAAGAYFGGPMGAMIGGSLGTGLNNYLLQKDVYKYQRGIQQDIFSREDNSVQRRIADLKAAGLSPALALGQSAGAGSAVGVTAPQMDIKAEAAMQLMAQKAAIDQTIAQTDLTKLNQENAQKSGHQIDAQIASINADTATKLYDLEKAKESGMATTASGIPKQIRDTFQLIKEGPIGTMFKPSPTSQEGLDLVNSIRKNRNLPPLDMGEYLRRTKNNLPVTK